MRITADALSGLVTWLARDHWRDAFQEVLEEHFGEPCEAAGLDTFDELADIVGDHWFNTLWGCAFGDLLTRPTEHGTIVDDYLKRRGWNETALHRAYMEALRDSVMSLYEVSDIRPGESFLARDLVRGGEPILVHERTATRTLKPWDRVALRIVAVRGRTMIGGGMLPFEVELADDVLETLRGVIDDAPPAVVAMLGEGDAGLPPEEMKGIAEQLAMRLAAPIFTAAWLSNHLDELLDPQPPTVMNSDGEAMELIRLHYRLAEGVTAQQLRATLDATPELHPASATFWNWLQPPSGPRPAGAMPEGAHTAFSTMPDGSVVLGTLELEGRALEVQVSSESRAERVRALLAARLPNLVSEPLIVRQTLEQALAEHRENPPPPAGHGLLPEEERQVIHQVLDRHYRALLDEPVPGLGNITPRQAARSPKGRETLVAWLEHLENQTARLDDASPMAAYDLTWMWTELGVAERRK